MQSAAIGKLGNLRSFKLQIGIFPSSAFLRCNSSPGQCNQERNRTQSQSFATTRSHLSSLLGRNDPLLMSKLHSAEGSFSLYILQNARRATTPRLMHCLHAKHDAEHRRGQQARLRQPKGRAAASSDDTWLEACFIDALTQAGRCMKRFQDFQNSNALIPKRRLQRPCNYLSPAKSQSQRSHSSFALKHWGLNGEEKAQYRAEATRGRSIRDNATMTDLSTPADLDEYYRMLDKCFLNPKSQQDATKSDYPANDPDLLPPLEDFPSRDRERWRPRKHTLSANVTRRSRTNSITSHDGNGEIGYSVAAPQQKQGACQEPAYRDILVRREEALATSYEAKTIVDRTQHPVTRKSLIDMNLMRLADMVKQEHGKVRHEDIFESYQRIPEPRLNHIPERCRLQLLGHLSVVRKRSEASRIRFLTVMEDHVKAGIRLGVREWTTAIHLTGKANKKISSANLDSALKLWREMETEAGVTANIVTFNTLFDMAIKAGKFVLADMIIEEMEHRQLKFDQYSHTIKIYYHGIRGSAVGVRLAYNALVNFGGHVDTAVISAVIAAYLKCYEPSAAEHVFDQAKKLHAQQYDGPRPLLPHNWSERRRQGKMFTAIRRSKSKQVVNSPIAPGWHAYRELIYYHAVTTGNIDRALDLADEMAFLYKIPIGGQIFMNLFKGFAKHGGARYSSWTSQYLEAVFGLFLRRLEESTNIIAAETATSRDNAIALELEATRQQDLADSYLQDRLVVGESLLLLCVSAFLKCSSLERAEQVCAILCSHVEPSEGLRERIDQLFDASEADEDVRLDTQNDRRLAFTRALEAEGN